MTTTKRTIDATIAVPIPVSVQLLRDLLCTAVEGGSNYWAWFSEPRRTESLDYLSVKVKDEEGLVWKLIEAESLATGVTRLARAAANGGKFSDGRPFPAASQHLANLLGGHWDAETADVVLQMTMFDDLVYG